LPTVNGRRLSPVAAATQKWLRKLKIFWALIPLWVQLLGIRFGIGIPPSKSGGKEAGAFGEIMLFPFGNRREIMTIGKKLTVAFIVLLSLLVVLGGILALSFGTMKSAFDHSVDKKTMVIAELGTLRADMKMSIRGMIMYTYRGNPAQIEVDRKAFHRAAQQFAKDLKELKPLLETEQERQAVERLETLLPVYEKHFSNIDDLCKAGQSHEATDYALGKIRDVTDGMLKSIQLLEKSLASRFESDRDRVKKTLGYSGVAGAVNFLAALLVATAVVLLIRRMNKVLRGLAADLSQGSEQVTSAASQVSSLAQGLAQGASEQAASLEETSASTEQITSMTLKNADNSKDSAKLMADMAQQVSTGNRRLEEMIASMNEITTSSEKISKIIKTIDEIAFQTNILALNAAVEAARAGEAGMGFAVVADEVRNLAQRCAQAAKDTADLIQDSVGKSHEGRRRLEEVSKAISAITEDAEKVKTLVDEVSCGSQEQARGLEQVSKAVGQMEQATQKTASSAEEGATAGEELTAQAQGLHNIVARLQGFVGTR